LRNFLLIQYFISKTTIKIIKIDDKLTKTTVTINVVLSF